ncbi:helix-turn-helix domain-containing protein [Streptomyces albidoflavus]|uniref:DNA-binding protein n=1 Tax=Streptomyces wadayamensis TaxID=141454 RepID=A0ABR4S4E6_9ACTN|nr:MULTISPECIES: helix-turn-helix transcriptional regulator [Streptomyces]KDR60507.1 DNA-binding protein [Streptomyces wadayamensis]MCL6280177.1 helix-turn-helix domain-containing protein [Streptomyces albidoflavus]MCX4464512.1 helix-turn-helix domain-containing protein [Streptomyces albidoflavus]QXQ26827.1 helix-turn-helix domain-containing protein [Streptomyces albidoflavus]QXQ32754.1 helix-turn-helix domain-containing protein [Streptomyces albidoflavus]
MSAPTVRRRRLGAKLRTLRGELTLEEVAEASGGLFVTSKLSRIETAKSAAKAKDVETLLDLYASLGREVSDELRSALVTLTKEGSQRGWWHAYRGVLSPVHADLISLESEAESILSWQVGAIPGLLHTAEYAREIIRATAMSEALEARVDALVEVRLARQAVLTREDPVSLWAIIAEHALRSSSQTDGAMREQLGRLLSMGKRPNVNIQVLPSDAPLHVGQLGSFTLLGFGPHPDLDVVHTESLTSALYVEERDKVAAHRDAWQRLTSAAASVDASADLITQIRKKL